MMNLSQGELDIIRGVLGAGLTSLLGFLSHNVFVKSKVVKSEGVLSKVKDEIELHQTLAREACQFAQESFREFGGARKLDAAVNFLKAEVKNKLGIDLDSTIAEGYVTSALKALKLELGQAWDSIPVPAEVKPVQTVQNVEPQSQATVTVTHVQPVE